MYGTMALLVVEIFARGLPDYGVYRCNHSEPGPLH
jgi:hypothetical protein